MVHFSLRLKNVQAEEGGGYKVSSVVQALSMFILTRQNVCVELMKHWSVNHIYTRVPMGAGIVCLPASYLARFSLLSCRPRNTAKNLYLLSLVISSTAATCFSEQIIYIAISTTSFYQTSSTA